MALLRTAPPFREGDRPLTYYVQERPGSGGPGAVPLSPRAGSRLRRAGGLGAAPAPSRPCRHGPGAGPEAGGASQRHLDHVVTADVELDGLPFSPASFDAILFADVLEHLVDPGASSRTATPLLAPGGVVIASIPNIQNLDVIRRLIRGRFDYRESGASSTAATCGSSRWRPSATCSPRSASRLGARRPSIPSHVGTRLGCACRPGAGHGRSSRGSISW